MTDASPRLVFALMADLAVLYTDITADAEQGVYPRDTTWTA